jgi:hypothetical protein
MCPLLTHYQRIGRIGGLLAHSRNDSLVMSAPGRETSARQLNERLLSEIDQHAPGLPEAERQRRLEAARSAHFARLSLAAAKARAAKKAVRNA